MHFIQTNRFVCNNKPKMSELKTLEWCIESNAWSSLFANVIFKGMVPSTELFTPFSGSGQYRKARDRTVHPRSLHNILQLTDSYQTANRKMNLHNAYHRTKRRTLASFLVVELECTSSNILYYVEDSKDVYSCIEMKPHQEIHPL